MTICNVQLPRIFSFQSILFFVRIFFSHDLLSKVHQRQQFFIHWTFPRFVYTFFGSTQAPAKFLGKTTSFFPGPKTSGVLRNTQNCFRELFGCFSGPVKFPGLLRNARQAAKRDVIPSKLNLAGSLKCSWLSNTLSGFSCLVSCVKMPSCSAPGCSNRSDKDPEKTLKFL